MHQSKRAEKECFPAFQSGVPWKDSISQMIGGGLVSIISRVHYDSISSQPEPCDLQMSGVTLMCGKSV